MPNTSANSTHKGKYLFHEYYLTNQIYDSYGSIQIIAVKTSIVAISLPFKGIVRIKYNKL
ncbi:hypothetical protein [Flavobacterium sp. LB1P62]|uniref:hypothetical protein n=1 Tax=Flavobacterium sp. LB1P62 TaxID=3401715 RepID=UPI003AAEDDBC